MKTLINLIIILTTITSGFPFATKDITQPGYTCVDIDLIEKNENCFAEMSYEVQIKSILNETCALSNCHVNGSSVKGDFSSYSGVKIYIETADNFEERIVKIQDMPPFYSPGPKKIVSEDLKKIECWIEQGYPK